jgi:hypothetical protein
MQAHSVVYARSLCRVLGGVVCLLLLCLNTGNNMLKPKETLSTSQVPCNIISPPNGTAQFLQEWRLPAQRTIRVQNNC